MNFVQGISSYTFANNYGKYADNFKSVNSMGDPSFMYVWLIIILSFVLNFSGLFSIVYSQEDDKKNTSSLKKNSLLILGLLFIALGVAMGLEGGYRYIFVYLFEYVKWLDSLPPDGKNAYMLMKSISSLNVG